MLRQRPGKNDGPVGHVSPLDSDEQEELLATLSLEANRQTSLFQVSERSNYKQEHRQERNAFYF